MLITNLIHIVKREFENFNKLEGSVSAVIIFFILTNALVVRDNPFAVSASVFGILYTIMAGKGKVSCYIFGIIGAISYAYLSLKNALWGSFLLSAGYYVPMDVWGFFKWRKHLKKEKAEIIKTRLNSKARAVLVSVAVLGSGVSALVLAKLHDNNPIADGIITFLSILGMYLTVKRCIEQWIIWIIVNGTACVMWILLIINGSKAYSTVIMWAVYLVLGFYFYSEWKKELGQNSY